MGSSQSAPKTLDEYIASFPEDVQAILQEIRRTIKAAAPDVQETIKYGIPTFTLNGNLVHFGGYREHIGFYPTPEGIEAFRDELAKYEKSKGTVRFPLDQPIPYDLITRIVRFRVDASQARAGAKRVKRS